MSSTRDEGRSKGSAHRMVHAPARLGGCVTGRKLFVGLVVTVLALSGCSGGSSSGGSSGGDTLTVATINDLRDADNIVLGSAANDRVLMGSTVYDPLFATDEHANAAPALALSADTSPDAKTWTLHLRQGVKFSNGKAFTSKDVKANFDAFMDPANASSFLSNLSNVTSIDIPDDYTVVFHLKAPDSRFTANMIETMFISDLDARKSGPLLQPGEVPIGTGPYKWDSREPGTSVTFVPNEDYWRGKPPLGKVVFKGITDPQAATLALQKGEVDVVANNPAIPALPDLEKDSKIKILHAEGSYFFQAYTNFEKARKGGYTDGDKVHMGLALLANAQNIVPGLIGAFGTAATQPIPSWQEGFSKDLKPYDYDEARGKQLLADGGIPQGGTIRMLAVKDRPYLCQWATAFQSNLKQLGYDAQLDCQESAVIPAAVTKYDWDLLFWATSGRATAATMYDQRWGVAPTLPEPDDTNTLRDYDLQGLIDKMIAAVDPKEYSDLGAQIADRVVKTDAAVIPGYFQDVYMISGPRVQGLTVSPLAYYNILYNAMGKVTVTG
jgi:peptide/nickel transport system substrate-binding protein